jgi:hypothetical protein
MLVSSLAVIHVLPLTLASFPDGDHASPHAARSTEVSVDNHFMYYHLTARMRASLPEGWEKPTAVVAKTYADWLYNVSAPAPFKAQGVIKE